MPDNIQLNNPRNNQKNKVKVVTNKKRTRRSQKSLQKIKDLFIKNLEYHANITEAFKATPGIKYLTQIYRWKETDEEFKAKFDEIRLMITGTLSDRLEDELVTRATRGKVRKIYYQGVETAQDYEPSDDLLKFALKANNSKYAGTDEMHANLTINIQAYDSKGMPIEDKKTEKEVNPAKKDVNPLESKSQAIDLIEPSVENTEDI